MISERMGARGCEGLAFAGKISPGGNKKNYERGVPESRSDILNIGEKPK
jgi:hypothetical protein